MKKEAREPGPGRPDVSITRVASSEEELSDCAFKHSDISIKNNPQPCAVCFCNERGIALSAIIESPVDQWLAVKEHEKHNTEEGD